MAPFVDRPWFAHVQLLDPSVTYHPGLKWKQVETIGIRWFIMVYCFILTFEAIEKRWKHHTSPVFH